MKHDGEVTDRQQTRTCLMCEAAIVLIWSPSATNGSAESVVPGRDTRATVRSHSTRGHRDPQSVQLKEPPRYREMF